MNRTIIHRDLRSGRVPKRHSFAYGRTLVISRLILLLALVALVGVTVGLTPSFPTLSLAILSLVLVGYFVLLTVSPLLTEHWVTRSRLILRQGWYFRAVIPFAEIEKIEAADDAGRSRVPLGIHRPMGQPSLFVTGGRQNLVSVRLTHPWRFWQAFGLTASEIIFDVIDREGFLSALAERGTSLPPIEADRADAELRD